ncbi:MAG: hypothetical protein IPQ03_13230 [Bacteroidetes bacterium]|nr:hypothetical protein [Bacteroidota bacterium]
MIGGGGSILAVPVLLLHGDYSCACYLLLSFVLWSVTSAVGAANYARRHLIHLRAALLLDCLSLWLCMSCGIL